MDCVFEKTGLLLPLLLELWALSARAKDVRLLDKEDNSGVGFSGRNLLTRERELGGLTEVSFFVAVNAKAGVAW